MPEENYGLYFVIFVAIVILVFIYVQVKEKMNLKKAATGEDKARFQDAVRRVMGEGSYTILYSHWEDVEYYGRSRKTTYYRHALAFEGDRLWIMPVRFEKELIMPGDPVLVTKDVLGIVDVNEIKDKKTGKTQYIKVTLNDKNGTKLVDLGVHAVNTKEDRFYPLNLLQEEECAQFSQFIADMSGQVSQENADLPQRLKDEANAKRAKSARTLAIVGIVFGIIFPIVGLVLGIAAIINAPKPKATDGKMSLPLILGIVALVLSIVMMVFGSPIMMEILKMMGMTF